MKIEFWLMIIFMIVGWYFGLKGLSDYGFKRTIIGLVFVILSNIMWWCFY